MKEFLVEDADHARARAGGQDDIVYTLVHIEEPLRQRPRLLPVAGIEGGLAAARLLGIEVHVNPMTAKDTNRALPDLGEELVYDAGDEERNALGGRLTHRGTCLIGGPPR